MKPRRLFLIGSIAANAILGAALVVRWLRADPVAGPPTVDVREIAVEPDAGPPASERFRVVLSDDLATFAANLRAAGLPEYLVRAAVNGKIDELFRAREEALKPKRPKLNYWQRDTYVEPLEIKLAQLDLKRDKARLRDAVLGPDPHAGEEKYDYVPSARRELFRVIVEDYGAAIDDIERRAGSGALLPSEKETLSKLRADQRRELEQLLTPAELAEHELRSSPATAYARRELRDFAVSEDEFRSIQKLQRNFDERFVTYHGEAGRRLNQPLPSTERDDAQKEMQQQVKGMLGDERFAEYRRATDLEFAGLSTLAKRAGLSESVAQRAYEIREAAAAESAKLKSVTGSDEEKLAMLHQIAARSRDELTRVLGPEISLIQLSRAAWWLDALERGSTFSGSRLNQRTSPVVRPVRPPSPAPTPPPRNP